ncbi:hypothetical protein P3T42_001495 [Paraburkholderia sp. GAS38]|uniref:hypothetical protein n=1 Tax=Paraburkholderia sp. GAS38 TaxID=3035133 RepID=UPI003D204624
MENKVTPRFRFPSYVNLKRHLGEYDALVELNELAVRSLLHRIKGEPQKLLKDESEQHQIRVDHNEQLTDESFAARRTQFYVLSVYQQAEQFFYDLVNDLPQGDRWKKASGSIARGNDEAELDWIIRITKKELPDAIDEKEDSDFFDDVSVFTYFRLVRNAFMHEGKETRQLKNYRDKLQQRHNDLVVRPAAAPKNARARPFVVPNAYDKLQFSDFILFTRVVKSVAARLCGALKPELDVLLKHRFSQERHYGLRKFLTNDTRFASACKTRLTIDYNLTAEEISYSIPVVKLLISAASTR